MYIHITNRPDGEAPEWVRKAWIGLFLPLAYETSNTGRGVLTHELSPQRGVKYAVEYEVALQRLAEVSVEAAQWWKNNTRLGPGRFLLFDGSCCDKTEDNR